MRTNEKQKRKFLHHWQVIALYLILFDLIAINLSYFLGLLLRFDFHYSTIPMEYLKPFAQFMPIYTVFCIAIFGIFKLYNSLWRFAGFSELNRIVVVTFITTLFHIIGITFIQRMPVAYYFIGPVLQFFFITTVRFMYRYVNILRIKREKSSGTKVNAMIIGAGSAGQMILKELKSSHHLDLKPVCVIDDNPNKWNRVIEGIPVVGGRDNILEAVKKYKVDQILFAIPSTNAANKRDILNICKETSCELKTLPGIFQLTNGEVSLSKMKPVAVEDLLGRDTIKVNLDEIFAQLRDKVILVTGGGGSIGSELCCQIAAHQPKQLIIFDIYENNAYEIEQELKRKYPSELNLKVLIGSVRDSARLNQVFQQYHPDIVYHAAAHKHVPLMETSPNESIKNNVIGTYKTAYAALKYGTKKFVLISTVKAVNPTSIMGASKRLCEMIIQTMSYAVKEKRYDLLPLLQHGKYHEEQALTDIPYPTQFVAVRFGNVLGSNGSVIPLFKKQIETGGPVTVTDPEIIRYFMTIPEAVSLVLQAGSYGKGGEIFVLDMGEPVKIDTLARNLIKLSGYRVNEDIKIEYTGLRPGEKMYEEKLMSEEGLEKTANKLIHIGKPLDFDKDKFVKDLELLEELSYNNAENIVEVVEGIVPTFKHQL